MDAKVVTCCPGLCATVSSLRPCASINLLLSDFHCLFLSYYNPESVFSHFKNNIQWQCKGFHLSEFYCLFLSYYNPESVFFCHYIQSSGSVNFLLSYFHCLFLCYYNPESVFSYFPLYTAKCTANNFELMYSRQRMSQNSFPKFIYVFPNSFIIFWQECTVQIFPA
jgi:hypothetical protein